MNKVELLAPAGSMESLYAAINNGADAVYLGGDKFSARAYASNFDKENMEKAVDYAHLYSVKIYATINTLIKEEEMNSLLEYTKDLYKMGIDGVILQDLGAYRNLKRLVPDLEIHGSTQMTVHNPEGAVFLSEKGFKRIVLSRELSLNEIEYISKDLGIETEIFVHGALCVCYSGMCLMSSMIGGRSGNRGRCAQSCRLPYTLKSTNGGKEFKGYLLSPKDICTVDDVKEILKTGTSSLKIEGRMKRPEYVAGVVSEYRKAIDDNKNKNGEKQLMKLFNREGFSKAYLYKNEGKDMMAYKYPKNTGVFVGKVVENSLVLLDDDISLKDGIRIGEGGFTVAKILLGGKEVEKASKGDKVKLIPNQYKKGDILYKTSDNLLLKSLQSTYNNIYDRKVDISCDVEFSLHGPIILRTRYMGENFEVYGENVEIAKNKPLSKERIQEALMKSGDTAFKITKVEFKSYEEGFVPVSSLNNVRRLLIEKIEENVKLRYKKGIKISDKHEKQEILDVDGPDLLFIANTKAQLKALVDEKVHNIGISIYNKNISGIRLKDLDGINGPNLYLKVPNIIKQEYNVLVKEIEENLHRFKGIITSNLGIIKRFQNRILIISDYKSNIFNSSVVKFFKENNVYPYLSQELNRKEIMNILSKEKNLGMCVYGKTESMISEYCPVGSIVGGKCSNKECSAPCVNDEFMLVDRMNKDFRVLTDKFCRAYIYNSAPINLIDEMEELKEKGVSSFRFDFIDEGEEEVKEILNYLKDKTPLENKEYTKGHYRRGVE